MFPPIGRAEEERRVVVSSLRRVHIEVGVAAIEGLRLRNLAARVAIRIGVLCS